MIIYKGTSHFFIGHDSNIFHVWRWTNMVNWTEMLCKGHLDLLLDLLTQNEWYWIKKNEIKLWQKPQCALCKKLWIEESHKLAPIVGLKKRKKWRVNQRVYVTQCQICWFLTPFEIQFRFNTKKQKLGQILTSYP